MENSVGTILQFKELAEKNYNDGNVEEAFKNYLICLRLYPEWKQDLKDKFVLVLCAYGEMLEENQKFDELFSCYEDALEFFCECSEILCNLGAHLCRLGFYTQAYYYFLEALRQDENYLPAYRNMQNASNCIVEQWHFRMLNDSYRNEAFREAIFKKVQQKFTTVLDIGTGTGLLSMYAVQSGALEVYGCDYNKEMISIANEVIQQNALIDKIVLINKISNDIGIPHDIPSRVSVVVTETMDSGLLGEHLLKTLSHAWEHLLFPPYHITEGSIKNDGKHGIVIPFGGSLYIAGVESNAFAKKFYYPLISDDIPMDDCIDALQCVSLNRNAKSASFSNISLNGLNFRAEMKDPYDTEHLRKSNYKFLTDTYEIFYINFNDPEDINGHLSGEKSCKIFTVKCTISGYLHAFAAWFKVRLDENIILCSSPTTPSSDTCCWDQAMFPLSKPIPIIPGCVLTLNANWKDGKVMLELCNCVFPSNNIRFDSFREQNCISFMVPQRIIRMLNDFSLIQSLRNCAATFIDDYDKCKKSTQNLYLLDLYPIPVFGLSVLHNSHLINVPVTKLFCIAESEKTKDCIRLYASSNSINLENIEFLSPETFNIICSKGQPLFDVIVTNLIDPVGDLDDSAVIQTSLFPDLLKTGGMIFPKEIKIYCQLIESNWLETVSKVTDKDIARFNIPQIINQFKVSHSLDLNLLSMEHKSLSEIVTSASIKTCQLNEEIKSEFIVRVTSPGSLTAICYWFGLNFSHNPEYSTLSDHSYVSQAAFLMENKTNLVKNNRVRINFLYQRGIFRKTIKEVITNHEW